MAKYSVRVSTGEAIGAGTWNKIAVSVVGTRGETPPLRLDHLGKEFSAGAVEEFEVESPQDVGEVLLLRVHKAPLLLPAPIGPLSRDAWFCRWFQLTPPQGVPLRFPCYQWLDGAVSLALRAGPGEPGRRGGLLGTHLPAPPSSWKTYSPGWPHCLNEKSVKDLDLNIKYSVMKNSCFYLKLPSPPLPPPEYVVEHWQEDAFFASQFLNGHNPVLIRRCRHLPENFPVTEDMVAPVLGPGTSLKAELERGSVFLVDHGILSGIHGNVVNGQPQFSAAPMTLLYQRPRGGPLLPLAIQLSQTPGPDSPIFLPSDNKWDWLLAKTWVRNAEFSVNEALTHLLQAHLLPEVFTMATLRQLPQCHPLFKVSVSAAYPRLCPCTSGCSSACPRGALSCQAGSTGIGIEGFSELIQRNMEQLNYSVLCLPEDIRARGVEDIPNYYYRDDGLQIWAAVESFVSEIINIYYPSDVSVRDDGELQAWVQEIFLEGFLGRKSSGMPSALETREALVQYITMVIFSCSARHYAVSAGQFDSCVWMPNLPPSMQLPPPTSKGQTKPEGFLATLPPVNATCDIIITLWLLSKEPGDQRPLGTYPDEHFTEEAPQQSIAAFQSRLAQISKEIQERNQGLPLPYTYLDPPLIENSVSI
uniref:Polyunsaturated fatty acid lipoxygenase ALOX15 n=1 Tax=Ursus americanus TaxID=9643 RepID=A0A452QLC1_URSAM